MTRFERLKREARETATARGHELGRFLPMGEGQRKGHRAAFARCGACGMGVTVETKPPPNGIEIGGEAVALTCTVDALGR